jgi:hypothetical protein
MKQKSDERVVETRNRVRARAKAVELLNQFESKAAPPPGRYKSQGRRTWYVDASIREQAPVLMTSELRLLNEKLKQQEFERKHSPMRKFVSSFIKVCLGLNEHHVSYVN